MRFRRVFARFGYIFTVVIYLLFNLLLVVYADNLSSPNFFNLALDSGRLKEVFPELAKPTQATSFYIEQSSLGLGHNSTYYYSAERKDNHFVGSAVYVKSYGVTLEQVEEINLPEKTVQKFVQTLLDMPIYAGPYNGPPLSFMTDVFPRMRILVQTNRGWLKISSSSQERDFVPWTVEFGGKVFTGKNAAPFDAYLLLNPYLKTEVRKALDDKALKFISWRSDFVTKPSLPIEFQPSMLRLNSTLTPLAKDSKFSITTVALSPDNKTWAIGTNRVGVQLWNSTNGAPQTNLGGDKAQVTALAYSKDGRYLASASSFDDEGDINKKIHEDLIKVWDMQPDENWLDLSQNTQPHSITLIGHTNSPQALAFSPNGKLLASAGEDRVVRLWEIPSGKSVGTLSGTPPEILEIQTLAFSPDGQFLAAAAGKQHSPMTPHVVQVWEVATGKQVASLKGHNTRPQMLAFSPDGKTLASTSSDKTVQLWEVASWQERQSWTATEKITALNYSPNGKLLAATLENGLLSLWEANTGQLISHTIVQNFVGDIYLAFAADGKQIYTIHQKDSPIKTWWLP